MKTKFLLIWSIISFQFEWLEIETHEKGAFFRRWTVSLDIKQVFKYYINFGDFIDFIFLKIAESASCFNNFVIFSEDSLQGRKYFRRSDVHFHFIRSSRIALRETLIEIPLIERPASMTAKEWTSPNVVALVDRIGPPTQVLVNQ